MFRWKKKENIKRIENDGSIVNEEVFLPIKYEDFIISTQKNKMTIINYLLETTIGVIILDDGKDIYMKCKLDIQFTPSKEGKAYLYPYILNNDFENYIKKFFGNMNWCPICEKQLSYNYTNLNHINSNEHRDKCGLNRIERQKFKCDKCNKNFRDNTDLQRHISKKISCFKQ